MCLEIRESVFGDLPLALRLDQEAFGPDAWTILDYLGVFSEKSVRKFTAGVDGKFAGFAATEFDDEKDAACLMTLAVCPEFRGQGIGGALLERCESCWDTRNYYLYVDVDNGDAIRLYDRAGYTRTGTIRNYYMNGHDAIVMEKKKK